MNKIQQVLEENEKEMMSGYTEDGFLERERAKRINRITFLRLIEAFKEMINLILPLAKGYTAEHRVGSNQKYIEEVEETLSELEKVVKENKEK